MKKIIAIAWKDFRLRFTNPSEFLFFLILPVLFTFLVAQFTGGYTGDGGDNRILVPVVDADQSALSGELIAELGESQSVRPDEQEQAAAEEAFEEGDYAALLIVPAGFDDLLRQGQAAPLQLRTDPNNANALAIEQAVRAAASQVSRTLAVAGISARTAQTIQPFADQAEQASYFNQGIDLAEAYFSSAPRRLDINKPATSREDEFDPAAFGSAGQLIIWVFIPLLGTSELFAMERAAGTLRRLLTTPTPRATYLLGTITGQLGAGFLQMIILVVFGVLVMKVDWGQAPLALLLVLMSFGLAGVSMGVMLGTFTKTTSQAMGLSVMLGMAMGLLGGCMIPLELFPPTVATLVHILPTTWAMEAMTDLTMRGLGLVAVLLEIAILLGYAVIFFVIGVRRFKWE
jgi:ABC-2 type transport system permease protein